MDGGGRGEGGGKVGAGRGEGGGKAGSRAARGGSATLFNVKTTSKKSWS